MYHVGLSIACEALLAGPQRHTICTGISMSFDGFDALMADTVVSWNCPGAAIAVLRDKKILYQSAHGFGDVSRKQPLTENTRFALGSVTKSLTAMSVALLADEGRLEWDKPVWNYMPEFILEDPYVTRYLTLRDMLSHRTGLPRHDLAAWRLDLSRGEFVKRMRHLKFSSSLRDKYQYNNLMYAAVAHLVEKISGQTWEEFVGERIFAPLGMTSSNFEPSFGTSGHLLAEGYRIERDENGKFDKLVHVPFGRHTALSPGPAGALFSTLADLTQWLQVQIGEGMYGDFQLVSKTNLKPMHKPQMVIPTNESSYALSGLTMHAYGMGWMIRPYPFATGTVIYHDGNVEGHSCHICFVPEFKLGVVVLTNAAASSVPTILAREAMDRALSLPSRDWNKKFHTLLDPIHAAAGRGRRTSAEERLKDAPSSHAIEAYEGTYHADGYPDFAVRIERGKLSACTVESLPWSELRHYHHDIFEWYIPIWDEWIKAKFLVDEAGDVGAISMPLASDVPDIVFKRKSLVVEPATLADIAGVYDPGINGMLFYLTTKGGKLYWNEPGQPLVEAAPCKSSLSEVEFKVGRSRVVVRQIGGVWALLVAKTPSATFEATRC